MELAVTRGVRLDLASRSRAILTRRPLVAGFVGFALLATLSRIASLHVPLDRDTGVYLYGGDTILHGGTPYVDSADNKGPVTFLLFAVIRLVSGASSETVRFSLILFMALAAVALAGYVKRFAGISTGLLAGAILAIVGSTHRLEGDDPNTEQYGIAPMVGAWWLATRGTMPSAAFAGGLTAAAILMNLGFAMVLPFVAWELWRCGAPEERRRRFLYAVAGGAAVAIPILAWLGLSGAFGDMRTQMLGQATQAVNGDLTQGHRRGLLDIPTAYAALALAGLGGAALAARRKSLRPVAIPVALWIIVMTARVKLSSYGSGQFYFPAQPGIAAGLALGMVTVVDMLRGTVLRTSWRRAALIGGTLAVLAAAYVVQPEVKALGKSPGQRLAADDASLRLAYPVSDFLRAHTTHAQKIFVAGSDAEVYWLADRRAP